MLATHTPAAPSVSGLALAAVIVPFPEVTSKTGDRRDSFSSVVSARGNASLSMPSTGTIRSSKKPRSAPVIAPRWLASVMSSCSVRPISHVFAISSQCSPMLLPVARFLMAGTWRRKSWSSSLRRIAARDLRSWARIKRRIVSDSDWVSPA